MAKFRPIWSPCSEWPFPKLLTNVLITLYCESDLISCTFYQNKLFKVHAENLHKQNFENGNSPKAEALSMTQGAKASKISDICGENEGISASLANASAATFHL
jgi:hypothetical protein